VDGFSSLDRCGTLKLALTWEFSRVSSCLNDALWRRAAFKLQPPMLGTVGVTPFSGTLVPSSAMLVYAALYAVLLIVLAQLLFSRRDL
jgi:hypothetical protein